MVLSPGSEATVPAMPILLLGFSARQDTCNLPRRQVGQCAGTLSMRRAQIVADATANAPAPLARVPYWHR